MATWVMVMVMVMVMATTWAMVTATRVVGNKEGNGNGGKSDGYSDKGGRRGTATRVMAIKPCEFVYTNLYIIIIHIYQFVCYTNMYL
jgi:hypothetical protein